MGIATYADKKLVAGNMHQREGISYKQIILGSGAILAFFVGSGFASGQEVLQFFGAYGTGRGILGIGLSMLLLFVCIKRVLHDGGTLCYEDTSEIFVYYCGRYLGTFLKWMTPIFLFLSYSVMLSGSGALLHEYFRLEPWVGCMVQLVLCLGTVLLGLGRLLGIMGVLGPVVVGMVFLLGGICVSRSMDRLWVTAEAVQAVGIMGAADRWWMSAVLYAGFSVMISLPFLSGLAQRLKEHEQVFCAKIGSAAYFAGTFLICLGMLANLDQIAGRKVPTLFLTEQIFPGAGIFFVLFMFVEIYTTAVPMLWSVCNKLVPQERSWRFPLTAVLISAAAGLWGKADFAFLVGTVYPYIGGFGLAVMGCMWLKTMGKRRKMRSE